MPITVRSSEPRLSDDDDEAQAHVLHRDHVMLSLRFKDQERLASLE